MIFYCFSVLETSLELVMLTNNIFQISLYELAICYALALNNRKCHSDVILLIQFLSSSFFSATSDTYIKFVSHDDLFEI